MRKLAIIVALSAIAWAIAAAYQIGACEVANIELQDEMQDLASQLGTRVGYSALKNDEELRSAVILKAERYGIGLKPSQVTVEHMSSGYTSTVYLAADYITPVHLPGLSFTLHFKPATDKKLLVWRTHGTIIVTRW